MHNKKEAYYSVDLAQGLDALQHWWVRMVPGRIEPVMHWETQVVTVQFHKGTTKEGGPVHLACKGICLKLEVPTQGCHQELQQSVVWRKYVHEDENEAHKNWLSVVEAKRLIKPWVLIKHGKDEEAEKQMHLANDEIFDNMVQFPVPKLMSQYSQDLVIIATSLFVLLFLWHFLFLYFVFPVIDYSAIFTIEGHAFLKQSVKEDNFFLLEEAIKICIAVRRPL